MPTDTSVRPTAPKRSRTTIKPGKFLTTTAQVTGKQLTINLPLGVAKYLEVENGNTIYYSIINGVLQISTKEPTLVIPSMNIDGFLPQPQ